MNGTAFRGTPSTQVKTKADLVDLTVAILDGINETAAFPTDLVFPLLCEQLNAPTAILQRVDWVSGESDIVLHGSPAAWIPRFQHATRMMRHTHPLMMANAAGDLRPATAQEAAGGWASWQRSSSRAFLTELVSAPQMVSVGLHGSELEVLGIALARSGRDFETRDLEFFAEIQPVLQALDRHLRRLQVWRSTQVAPPHTVTALVIDSGLTGRELEVLVLLGQGLTAAAAGHRLRCSPRTVHRHVANLFRKLEVHDRLGAVLEAQRRGLIAVPSTKQSATLPPRIAASTPLVRGPENPPDSAECPG